MHSLRTSERTQDHLLESHRDFYIDHDYLTDLVKEDDGGREKRRAQDELAVGSRLTSLGRTGIAFVRGARGTDLCLSIFTEEDEDAAIPVLDFDSSPWTSLVMPILQLNSRYDEMAQQHRKAWLGARTAVATSFFPLIPASEDQPQSRNATVMAQLTGNSRHADFAFAPTGDSRALIATESGAVYEADLDTGC